MGMSLEDVPFALGGSSAKGGVVRLVDMLEVGLKVQPMLAQNVAVEVLAECNLHHSRLHLFDPEGIPGRNLPGLHEGVHNELLLGLTVSVPEAVKALVGHANKLGMLLLILLVVGRLLGFGRLIRSRNLGPLDGGQRLLVVRCGYPKDFGAA